MANYEITEDDYKGKAGALDYNWFCLKLRRHDIANAYIMNFYVFHELAHIKMDFDTRLSSYYHSLVHMQVNQLAGFVRAINPNVVDTSLLPLEDIACDTYALDLLFKFINANTGDYNFEFMVEAYLVAVSNNTLLNSIHRQISMLKASMKKKAQMISIIMLMFRLESSMCPARDMMPKLRSK